VKILHEASIALELYNIVEENIIKYKLKTVTIIRIKVGSFNGVYQDSLKFAFQTISKGTKSENAKIIIDEVEGFELLVDSIEGEDYE
jgi:hydrogenase nickel incorporation protein HypA/HybF